MKDKPQDAQPELPLAERRERLANALGFLLARAWLREHSSVSQDRPASAAPDCQQDGSANKPP